MMSIGQLSANPREIHKYLPSRTKDREFYKVKDQINLVTDVSPNPPI